MIIFSNIKETQKENSTNIIYQLLEEILKISNCKPDNVQFFDRICLASGS